MEPEKLWRKGFVKQMSFKSEVKGRVSDIVRANVLIDCDEVICAGWGEPGGEWTGWGWTRRTQNSTLLLLPVPDNSASQSYL